MRLLRAVLFLVLASAAQAEPFPALYDVTGVAADDVLNVRSEPDPAASRLGALAPGATGIEVVRLSPEGGWGLVNAGEEAGWVSMRYLSRQPGQDWGTLPGILRCGGTEPFWNFDIPENGAAAFSTPEGTETYFLVTRVGSGFHPADLAAVADGTAGRVTAMVAAASCNDGMSEQEYGMRIGLLLESDGEPVFHIGCCSLEP